MKSSWSLALMELYPKWNEWKARRASDAALRESKGQSPNYSFDNWLKMTKSFGDEVSSFVGQAKEKDKELDDEIKSKKQEPLDKDKDKDNDNVAADSKDSKTKETAWKTLKDIAKQKKEEQEKKYSKKPTKSSTSS